MSRRNKQISKAALFRQVGYEPHAGQLEVHQSRASRRVLACGVRWGKTTLAIHEALAALLSPTGPSRGWIVSPSYDTSDLVTRVLFELLETHFAHRIVELKTRERRAVVVNLAGANAEIHAKSAARPEALLGESLDWAIVDEAARLDERIWKTRVSQRLVDRKGWALLCSTPRAEGDWFHAEFQRAEAGDPGYASWTRPTWDNPSIDPDVVDVEKDRIGLEAFWREYGGQFVPASGWICPVCRWGEANSGRVLTVLEWARCRACSECERPVDEHGRPVGLMNAEGVISVPMIGHVDDEPAWDEHPDPVIQASIRTGDE